MDLRTRQAAASSLPSGKLPVGLLSELLATLPATPPEVLLGPRVGEDACAIDIAEGVLVAAADPITLTSDELGRLAVIINANDVAVTGAAPRWFLAVVLLPPGAAEAVARQLFGAVRDALAEVGAFLVGGHTEVTPAVTQPVVVGQMLGLVRSDGFVSTGGVLPGDVVIQVGPAPVEGAAILAVEAASRLRGLDTAVLAAAREGFESPGISVVKPALVAAQLGATALHDPTEGGLAAGLHEMSVASDVSIRIDRSAVLWFEPGLSVCRELDADPWATLASGTLLAAFSPDRAEAALRILANDKNPVAAIGTAEDGLGVRDEHGTAICWPERDEVDRVLFS